MNAAHPGDCTSRPSTPRALAAVLQSADQAPSDRPAALAFLLQGAAEEPFHAPAMEGWRSALSVSHSEPSLGKTYAEAISAHLIWQMLVHVDCVMTDCAIAG